MFLMRADFCRVRDRWDEFWRGENSRPLVWASCPRKGMESRKKKLAPAYPQRPDSDFRGISRDVRDMLSSCYEYVADELPVFSPSFGPDQFAGFLGAGIVASDCGHATSWAVRGEGELEDFLPLSLDGNNPLLRAMDGFTAELAAASDGRFIVSVLDYHSNLDSLAALRGPENICFDIIEKPAVVESAMKQVTEVFKALYNRYHALGGMERTGSSAWLKAYSRGRYGVISSDFICLLSPEASRKLVIPALEEEISVLDNSIFHLDGPGALVHLDDILSLGSLDAVQWVPGAGSAPNGVSWVELYRKILGSGKGLHLSCGIEDAKAIHREIRSPRAIYAVSGSRTEVEGLLEWMDRNT